MLWLIYEESKNNYIIFQVRSSEESNEVNQNIEVGTSLNETNVMLDPNDVVGDPGLRKPIENLDVNVTDIARRKYLLFFF